MQPQFSSEGKSKLFPARAADTQGFFVIVFAGILVAFIALATWALEISRLHRAKLALQNSVDAAAMGAIHNSKGMQPELVSGVAEKLLADNMRIEGLQHISHRVSPVLYTPPTLNNSYLISLKVSARSNVELPFWSALPGFPDRSDVFASATAALRPVVLELILDKSGSMLDQAVCASTIEGQTHLSVPCCLDTDSGNYRPCCEENGAPISCQTSWVQNGCNAQGANHSRPIGFPNIQPVSKLEALKQATLKFVDRFSEGFDWVGVMPFSSSTLSGSNLALRPLNKTNVSNFINGIQACGNTDIAHGLQGASGAFLYGLPPPPNPIKVFVLISDGAPTSGLTTDYTPPDLDCSVNPGTASQTKQSYYIRAIKQADFLRTQDILGFSIGFGENARNFIDPYQNISTAYDSKIKSNLLSRIANDCKHVFDTNGVSNIADEDFDQDGRKDDFDDCNIPDFPSECVDTFASMRGQLQGEYYEAPNGQDLNRFFDAIANKIKPSYIE